MRKSIIPFVLLAVVALIIGVATIMEDSQGTAFVVEHIYGTPWFYSLWGAVSFSSVLLMLRRKMWRRFAVFMLHVSFLVILAGALTTALTSQKGMMHLRAGVAEQAFNVPGEGLVPLPFSVTLDSFHVEYYPGTEAPSDYVSDICCAGVHGESASKARVSMNNIHSVAGYRFYQSSFDEDMRGSWLTVNHDPWGMWITYAGYALLAVSMLLFLVLRSGELKRLLRNRAIRGAFVFLLLFLPSYARAAEKPLAVVNLEQAEDMKNRQVIYNDRVTPLNTLALDFTLKITGKTSFRGLTAEQVMLSWMLYPDEWQHVEMIKIKSGELRRILGVDGDYASFATFFDETGKYRLEDVWREEQGKHSKLEKAVRETDEKVGLILMLTQGTLIKPLPADGSVRRLTENEVTAELLYNKIPFTKILFMMNLTLGFVLFFFSIYDLLHGAENDARRSVRNRRVKTVAGILLYAVTLFHLSGYVLRWYISGVIPLSNGYETMQFVALCVLLISCALHRKFSFTLPFGFLLSGFTLLVSYLGEMNPQITPLMPVLQSPWLSGHVSMIMVSYSLFAFMMLNGVTALVVMRKPRCERQVEALTVLSRIMLYPATFLLAAGIFMGAVWANVSWGSYWSWDPKEVWALITMIVYGMAFHRGTLPFLRSPKYFHLYMVLSFLTVLMTYFGVNYLLGGMHSYAS